MSEIVGKSLPPAFPWREQIALVVLSCDAYADLWPTFFDTFFRYWPDCPFDIYLVSNEKVYPDRRVRAALSGPDLDWSSSVRRSVQGIPNPHLFFLYDDAFFGSPVPTTQILDLLYWGLSNQVQYLRLRPEPMPDKRSADTRFGLLASDALYRTSCYLSLWDRNVFLSLLVDGETAWAFELVGSGRSQEFKKFYATYECPVSYLHGVEKGLWLRKCVRDLRRRGVEADLTARRQMTLPETFKLKLQRAKGRVFWLIPRPLRPLLARAMCLIRRRKVNLANSAQPR